MKECSNKRAFGGIYKCNIVDELFFYFSGHGHYDGSEFYYILSDYNSNKLRQTSLENSELDNLFRSLKPEKTIKIVDACNSGVGYIKDADNVGEYVKSTKDNFKTCYFMFSTQNDQGSYADTQLSYFTKSFLQAVCKHDARTIRYKDVVDYISDDFSGNARQKPLFAIQADFTDVFMDIPESIRTVIDSYMADQKSPEASGVQGAPQAHVLSLLQAVKNAAESYKDKAYIQRSLDGIKGIKVEAVLGKSVVELFEATPSTSSNSLDFPDAEVIGNWLNKDKSSPSLFAKATGEYRQVSRRVLKGGAGFSLSNLSSLFPNKDDDALYTTKIFSEWFVTGFSQTEEFSYVGMIVNLEPKYASLKRYTFYFVPIFSRTKAVCFSRTVESIEEGFGKYKDSSKTKWFVGEVFLENEKDVGGYFREKLKEFGEYILSAIGKEFLDIDVDLTDSAANPLGD
ncbi:caspase family protein [Mesorhizobium sp. IMUNJ 23033]|uniref:caspase family protein n=1 Tax=Mesorhizobium sp. IMUNJ 23033 TaxID=3378039 RepID=UPI00384A9041